jgi:hypothetical protein
MADYNFIQTFYVNPEAVDNAATVMLTSVELFFKSKPDFTGTRISPNTPLPGVNISICRCLGEEPVADSRGIIRGSQARVEYSAINAVNNATEGTAFAFRNPILVETGKTYGIVITTEDKAYEIWANVTGQPLMSATGLTTTPSSGSGANFKGMLYKSTQSTSPNATPNNVEGVTRTEYKAFSDRDLKFRVNIAKFQIPDNKQVSMTVVNKSYEFFTISQRSGAFTGGEVVYQNDVNKAGTILVSPRTREIVGTGTQFTNLLVGQHVVYTIGGKTEAMKIIGVNNDTSLEVEFYPSVSGTTTFKVPPVAKVYYTNYVTNNITLVESSALASTFRFTVNSQIVGTQSGARCTIASIDKRSVDNFVPRFKIGNPAFADVNVKYQFSYPALQSGTYLSPTTFNMNMDALNEVTEYDAYIYSRSEEVSATTGQFGLGDSKKSAVANITFTYDTTKDYSYIAPFIAGDEMDIFTYQNEISNTSSYILPFADRSGNAYSFDTETTKSGLATSKYLSKKINFGADRSAEDIIVYLTGYRPEGSDIKVYAKIHNDLDKEPFDDKTWTPLELKTNVQYFSKTKEEMVEYMFGLPSSPEVIRDLPGSFTTTLNSQTITTSADHTATLQAGDVIRLQDSLIPTNRQLFVISSVTSNSIVVSKPVEVENLVTGFITAAQVKYPYAAFNNIFNDNVSRYISSSLVEFDKFSTMQIKVVLLADSTFVVPKVEVIQAMGVSA